MQSFKYSMFISTVLKNGCTSYSSKKKSFDYAVIYIL